MEKTASSTTSTQGVISQNLTLEQVKKKTKSDKFDVRLGRALGSGAYGTVYSVDLYTRVQEKVAMKVIRREFRGQFEKIDQKDLVEIEIMSQIGNPYINKLIEYYFQEDKSTGQEELVLLQPLAMSDLKQFLINNYPKGRMPEKQAIEFLTQLTIGLKAMHDNKIIHRDLNPTNILVFKNDKKTFFDTQEYILRISDFGCSKILQLDENEAMTRVGKLSYMPSEQNSNKGYNQSVDIYALGLTMFEMITGQLQVVEDILSKSIKTEQYSPEFIDLLYQLCSIASKDRPTVEQILQNPLIQKSQTFLNCQLNGFLVIQCKAQEFIDELELKFPAQILEQRLKKPLKHSIPELGSVLYQMERVQTEFKHQINKWQAQYELAIGNNHKKYFIDKYEAQLQELEKLSDLDQCTFKREVEASGDIFVGFYRDGSKFYGKQYERYKIKEGHLKNGEFDGEVCEYEYNSYYDGKCIDGLYNGYGVMLNRDGSMYCDDWKNGMYHGSGRFHWNDGDIYEGQWINGDQHGKGVYKCANGDTKKGTWKDSQQHGEFIFTYANGRQQKIAYEMDREISRKDIKLP
eukprot:403357444